MIDEHEIKLAQDPGHIQFIYFVNDDKYEEIMPYNDIINNIANQDYEGIVCKFKRIVDHEGPPNKYHPNYKWSCYNVMVEWETGEISTKPLSIITADEPVTCSLYDDDKYFLQQEGW